jgi:hypothetical protein
MMWTLLFWMSWWGGSQQSRWLYPVLALGWLATLEIQSKLRPTALLLCLVASAVFSVYSQQGNLGSPFRDGTAIQREMAARVLRDETGQVLSRETLYVEEPLATHAPVTPYWILRTEGSKLNP